MSSSKTLAIVQARMSSQRLPGKVLRQVQGKPLFAYLLNRIKRSQKISQIVLATSTSESDDALESFAKSQDIRCVRGELDDVVSRFVKVLGLYPAASFARICADSPLYDPELLDLAINEFEKQSVDIVTNTLTRSYPRGMSVEIVRSSTFLKTAPQITSKEDREHITRFFYQHADNFTINNLALSNENHSTVNLSVDTESDLNNFSSAVGALKSSIDTISWREVLPFYTAGGR